MKRTIKYVLAILFTLCLVCALLTVTALAAPVRGAEPAPFTPEAEPKDGETEPSYTLSLPEAVTVTQNDVYTAVPVSVTELSMVTGSDGKTPTFLRVIFNGLTLTDVTDESKTISCQLRKNASDTPGNQKLYNVTAVGSCGVEIVIPAATWESAAPGVYTGSIQCITRWRYSNNTWSGDLEEMAIPVTAVVSEADPVVTFNLNGSKYSSTGGSVATLQGLEYCGVTPAPQRPGPGGLATEPAAPTVNSPFGWLRFGGWYTNQACTAPFDFDAPVVESLTLYAKWIVDEEYYLQKYNGLSMNQSMNVKGWDAYAATGDESFIEDNYVITDFDLIEGLDYDPEHRALIFNGYDGYMIRIVRAPSVLYEDSFVEIRVEGVNSIQLPFQGTTSPYTTYPIKDISFTGDGTINLNARAEDLYDRERNPWPIAFFEHSDLVTWDGPTLNVTGAGYGINNHAGSYMTPSNSMKMLSGEINIEITPADGAYDYGAVARANRLELIGGSLHVHYVKDLDAVTSRYWSTVSVGTISTGPHPVLVGMEYETYISPEFDFQVTVDQELTDLGFSVYPFDPEDFGFSYMNPEYTVPRDAHSEEYFIGDAIPDVNEIQGLSFDYHHYIGLDDELPHTLILENYSGPGLFARSCRYPFTRLDVELRGENTVYCNAYGGLCFDDLDVHFIGDGVLRIVSEDLEPRTYNTGDEFYYYQDISECGIGWARDGNSLMVEEGPPSVTVDGPTIILDGYYSEAGLFDLRNATVLSGSLCLTSKHSPLNLGTNNPIPARYTPAISMRDLDSQYVEAYEGVFLQGGETVINFQPSPIHADVFPLYINGALGLNLMALRSAPSCAENSLLLVGEERVLKFDAYVHMSEGTSASDAYYTLFTAANVRKIQTAEAEGGRALVRAEGGKAIVTPEPGPGMELVSLSYTADGGEPVEIPRGPEGWVFEYPFAQVITITPVFGPMDGYFLIGPDWNVESIDWTREFILNPGAAGEYLLRTELVEGDPIKVVHVTNGAIDAWYPEGTGNEYTVDAAHAGTMTVYFKTAYQNDWAAFGGYFYIDASEPVCEFQITINNTLALEGATTLNYILTKSELDALGLTDVKVVVVHTAYVDGEYVDETVELTDWVYYDQAQNYLLFKYENIAAKELNDKMVAHVEGVKDGVTFTSNEKEYNPMTYCYTIAQRETANANLRKTCADMIKYCAAAQECFSYNTANLADADWNDTIAAVATQGDPELANYKEDVALEGQTAAITTYTLDVSGRVNINYYVLPDDMASYESLTLVCTYKDVKGHTVTTEIPGTDWELFNNTYGYKATLNTVNAGEMREIITAVVKDANGSVISNTYKTSIETYAKTIVDRNNNQPLMKLMKAMLNYGTSAHDFLA